MVGTVAVLVNSVLPPVVDVHVAQTTHEQLHREGESWNHFRYEIWLHFKIKPTICGEKERVKSEELYLQFIFIKDLDQVYEDELSEALKNETRTGQLKDNSDSIHSGEHKDWAFTHITSMLHPLFNNYIKQKMNRKKSYWS